VYQSIHDFRIILCSLNLAFISLKTWNKKKRLGRDIPRGINLFLPIGTSGLSIGWDGSIASANTVLGYLEMKSRLNGLYKNFLVRALIKWERKRGSKLTLKKHNPVFRVAD